MTPAIDLGRHVLILTSAGSFTVVGRQLTGPVDSADKLGKLIVWAFQKHEGLQPIPGSGGKLDPARVWVTGGAVHLLAGVHEDDAGNPADRLGRGLATLVDAGWELNGAGRGVVLAHGRGAGRVVVEVVAEQLPWLAGGNATIAEDAAELGRRLGRWHAELGVLPGASGAISGALVADCIKASREETGRGAVVSGAGSLPGWVTPELRVQPAWSTTTDHAERELRHCDELLRLTQLSPALASAGMLTLGHGQTRAPDGPAAVSAANAPKRPFGLWLIDLPAASELGLPTALPLPHPQMAPDHRVQAWVTTEDLDGLAKDIRDGGAGLNAGDLSISEAIVWPQKARILEGWATRMRAASEAFADDEELLALVYAAADEYLAALADPDVWSDEGMEHHFQPAWAATIATHVRLRGRRAAMRISREHHTWPLYVEGISMVYGPSAPEPDSSGVHDASVPIDLSDRHTRLGRLVTSARTELTEKTILEVLLAEATSEVGEALDGALGPAPAYAAPSPLGPGCAGRRAESPVGSVAAVQEGSVAAAQEEVCAAAQSENETVGRNSSEADQDQGAGENVIRAARRDGGAGLNEGRFPAAVLHVDGLWLPDGTKCDVPQPIIHVGDVADLAYEHDLGYQLTPGSSEPGQIWVTDEACRELGIDVDQVLEKKPKDRDDVMREITRDIPFITEALASGWKLGGGGAGAGTCLGTWTRIYPADKKRKGVWVVLIPGMASRDDSPSEVANMPVLTDRSGADGAVRLCAPDKIAHRLKIFADALRFPLKINAGVTAIDLMVASRPKGTSVSQWCEGPLAPSTFDLPFTTNDVERDFNWTRALAPEEQKCRFVHAYDRGGSYPAAIAGLELPIGEPIHYPDGSRFEDSAEMARLLKMPGLVTIVVPEHQDWRVPFLLNPAGLKFTGPKQVTTARLQRAVQQGYTPTIIEAYAWPNHGRVLNGFYERVRNASVVLDVDDVDAQAARDQSKVVRSVGIGLLGSESNLKGKTGYDPMKRLSIVGKASANISYRIDEIGMRTQRWPVAAEKDTVLYVSDDPDPQTAWPGEAKTWGRGFGQYKHEGSALLTDHIDYLNGQHYKGKAMLLNPAEWAELMPTLDRGAVKGVC